MDERIRDRRRSILRSQGRRYGLLFAVAAVLVVGAALFVWLRSSDVFAVERVTATATASVTSDDIARATSPALGVSLLRVSTSAIEKALLALPYVRSAQVYRDFPHTLEVHIVEYRAAARVRAADGTTWLVSEDGRVLAKVDPPAGASLPLLISETPLSPVAGATIPEAVAASLPVATLLRDGQADATLQPIASLKEIDVSAGGEVSVKLSSAMELRLGQPSKLESKLKAAAEIIQQCLRDQKQVEYVDVSVPDRPAVMAK
jgi:cell division protein FtsQ